jgi:hypothetical protein
VRVTTKLFVDALLRRARAQGGFAVVLRKGAAEAGAVFIVGRALDGQQTLYAPAMQLSYGEGAADERLFERRKSDLTDAHVAEWMESEGRIDPDFWAVELEDVSGPLPFEIVDEN